MGADQGKFRTVGRWVGRSVRSKDFSVQSVQTEILRRKSSVEKILCGDSTDSQYRQTDSADREISVESILWRENLQ